jgi:hypothetical protein
MPALFVGLLGSTNSTIYYLQCTCRFHFCLFKRRYHTFLFFTSLISLICAAVHYVQSLQIRFLSV